LIHVGAVAEAPIDRPSGPSRIWRVVALVAAFHVLVGLIGFLFFSTMGLASDAVGSCGGG
jgi:hypothetical protein